MSCFSPFLSSSWCASVFHSFPSFLTPSSLGGAQRGPGTRVYQVFPGGEGGVRVPTTTHLNGSTKHELKAPWTERTFSELCSVISQGEQLAAQARTAFPVASECLSLTALATCSPQSLTEHLVQEATWPYPKRRSNCVQCAVEINNDDAVFL